MLDIPWKYLPRGGIVVIFFLLLSIGSPETTKASVAMEACQDLAFSVSEDFLTTISDPPGGNPIISDGDLIGVDCTVCARNADLLADFDVNSEQDLGLDAVDIIDGDRFLIAFSTEMDSPTQGIFKAGDLLVTKGSAQPNVVIIPNQALTYMFDQDVDLGLDAVHFVGDHAKILEFLNSAASYSRDDWLTPEPNLLIGLLENLNVDIWFSTEGTAGPVNLPLFLDGDLLSARIGEIIASNDELLHSSVPAGIPVRGVDFGLDAVTNNRTGEHTNIHFSTEILYSGEENFTDGDILKINNGVVIPNVNLISCFDPSVKMLGLDALFIGDLPANLLYLPLLLSNELD